MLSLNERIYIQVNSLLRLSGHQLYQLCYAVIEGVQKAGPLPPRCRLINFEFDLSFSFVEETGLPRRRNRRAWREQKANKN